jgi:N-acetylneuraminic acid mutarotase
MKAVRSLMRKAVLPVVVVGMLGAAVAVGGSEPVWKQLAAAPTARQEVSYTALGGHLYLAAGNDRSQSRYDPATDQWTSVEELPASFEGVDHVHGVAAGGRIAYIGGLTQWEHPFPVIGAVEIYDPVGDKFTSGTEMPSPRAAGGVAVWHNKVIYAGGLGPDGAVARVDMYDPQTDEWTRLADMPRPREHFYVAVVGDELYAIGGRETFESEGSIEIEEIAAVDVLDLPADDADLATAAWRSNVTSLPTPRGGLGVAAIGGCIYTIGGEHELGGVEEVTGATESYDPTTGAWHALPSLWAPRHGIQAATIGQTIYVAGGGTKPFDYSPTAAHEALDVSEVEPCTATEGTGEPPADSPPGAGPSPGSGASGTEPLRIHRLAVRPQRVRLRSGRPGQRGARIVIFLSRRGKVLLHLPRRFKISRHLDAGRNVIPLPSGAGSRPLPRGRYRLLARPHAADGGGDVSRAEFRVVD